MMESVFQVKQPQNADTQCIRIERQLKVGNATLTVFSTADGILIDIQTI